jgi:hypothetical protein
MNGFLSILLFGVPCSPCFTSQFWLLLYHSDGVQKNQDKNEQFNITYDQC